MSREYNFYVYMLASPTRSTLYIGVTNNLERRVIQHRQRERPGFTQRYKVDRLVYYEHFPEVLAALDREKQLKGWKRSKKDSLIAGMNPHWEDLSLAWREEQSTVRQVE